jgi:hypothetical protein
VSIDVIIAYSSESKEPRLADTIRSAQRSGVNVLAVKDDFGGAGKTRHRGIVNSKAKHVIITDAHMIFGPRFAEKMVAPIKSNPRAVVCCDCLGVTDDWKPNNTHRFGADFVEYEKKEQKHRFFVSKWRRGEAFASGVEEIPQVLGACYAFNREWYLDGLDYPWELHCGWGKSEQLLSVTNWMAGGVNLCVKDAWAAHLFRGGSPKRMKNVDYNAALIAWTLLSDKEREEVFGRISARHTDKYVLIAQHNKSVFEKKRAKVLDKTVKMYYEYTQRYKRTV